MKHPTVADLARIWRTSERQIYRWRDAGAPLLSWADMQWFFAGRRSFPPWLLTVTKDEVRAIQKQLAALPCLPWETR